MNSIVASEDVVATTDPSINAPLPASPWLNPRGSLALVTLPFVITLIPLIYGLLPSTVIV